MKQRKSPRHAFKFRTHMQDGMPPKILTAWAKVRHPTKRVLLTLTAEHVRKSIRLKGVGNTQLCSMAICTQSQPTGTFPHPVDGFIDWQYSRAYVVSRVSKETGWPLECFVYSHGDDIAKLNDTLGGQKKLLAELEREGSRTITLYPTQKRAPQPGYRSEGKRDGSRSKPVGAKLRFAVTQLGGPDAFAASLRGSAT